MKTLANSPVLEAGTDMDGIRSYLAFSMGHIMEISTGKMMHKAAGSQIPEIKTFSVDIRDPAFSWLQDTGCQRL